MAQKYIDTTLTTGLNDGSSIANAWQSFFQVITNTQVSGTYAAGDVINVRTHDGVADITETSTIAITTATIGTTANPVIMKFDNGVIWGTGGTFMYSVSGLKTSLTGCLGWVFEATKISDTKYGFRYQHSYTTHSNYAWVMNSCLWIGCDIEIMYVNVSIANQFLINNGQEVAFRDCRIKQNDTHTVDYFAGFRMGSTIKLSFDACIIDAYGAISAIQYNPDYGSSVVYRACRFLNVNPSIPFTSSSPARTGSGNIGTINIENCQGLELAILENNLNNKLSLYYTIIESGSNSPFSFTKVSTEGVIKWVRGFNYPTRTATLPDGTNWSIRVFPRLSTDITPLVNNTVNHYYNGVAKILTLTNEICIKHTLGNTGAFDNPTNKQWYINVKYIDDATGLPKTVRSLMDGSPLTPSTAIWVPEVAGQVSYGAINYDKYKLSVVTPTAVKANSVIVLTLYSTPQSVSTTEDYYFVDPQIGIA